MRHRRGLWVALLWFVLAWPAGIRAQESLHDTQLWLFLLGQIPVGKDWLVHAEVQPRWNDDISRQDQVLLRGGLGRRLGPRVTVWGGYAYTPRHGTESWTHEQRTWEQFNANLPSLGRWSPSIRFRQEQRFLDAWSDASHRFRAMGRLVRPLGSSGWSIAASDEYFVTLDHTGGGPRQGFDQNRVFSGVLRRLGTDVTFETGYTWQMLPKNATTPTRHNHIWLVWFTYAPPRR